MHECRLCSRDMKTSKDTFGNTCVRNIYSFLEMNMPRKMNLREITLYNNVMKINKISNINTYQKVWLTDRYLTQQYLNKIPYGNYTRLINQINFEMKNINQLETEEKPKSSRNMTLKQAYNLYKKATRFAEGNFTDKESIKLIISSFSFIFNMKKNSNQYEKNTFKAMQYAFWQSVIEIGGKYAGFDISADLLQHSLEKNPKDIYINDGKIVQAIIDDKNFKNNINNIFIYNEQKIYEFIIVFVFIIMSIGGYNTLANLEYKRLLTIYYITGITWKKGIALLTIRNFIIIVIPTIISSIFSNKIVTYLRTLYTYNEKNVYITLFIYIEIFILTTAVTVIGLRDKKPIEVLREVD